MLNTQTCKHRRYCATADHHSGHRSDHLCGDLGVSGQTIGRYLDLLVDLMLVRRLQPWHENVGKRLVKSPKVFVRDSGLVHALLGLGSMESLLGHPVVGGSWEGFCVETLIAAAPTGTEPFFYRTAAGAELDLVLRFPTGKIWAIEIKRTTAPKVSRGFHLGAEDIKADRKILVYAGERDVPGGEGLRAMPLATTISFLRDQL